MSPIAATPSAVQSSTSLANHVERTEHIIEISPYIGGESGLWGVFDLNQKELALALCKTVQSICRDFLGLLAYHDIRECRRSTPQY